MSISAAPRRVVAGDLVGFSVNLLSHFRRDVERVGHYQVQILVWTLMGPVILGQTVSRG